MYSDKIPKEWKEKVISCLKANAPPKLEWCFNARSRCILPHGKEYYHVHEEMIKFLEQKNAKGIEIPNFKKGGFTWEFIFIISGDEFYGKITLFDNFAKIYSAHTSKYHKS